LKQKKAIIFFSAGLGDALLLIPLVKRLKEKDYLVSGFFNSAMPCREMMEHTGLLDEIIDAQNKTRQALFSLKKMGRYELAVLNFFATNKKNLLTASLLAGEIVSNRELNGIKNPEVKINFIAPIKNVHDAEQNLLLVGEAGFKLADLQVTALERPSFDLPAKYTALQISSGNPGIFYKNWPVDHWMEFLALALVHEANRKFVLLGNESDIPLAQKLKQEFGAAVISLAGQTSIKQVMQVLSHAKMFVGLDGGLMHLAVAFGKPTFTIWGPSSEQLYGYEQFDPKMHKCVRMNLTCHPCNAWIEPNTSKTSAPELCPDHACLKQLGSKEVFDQFSEYLKSLPAHVR